MQFLWLLLAPVIVWLWAVSVGLTGDLFLGKYGQHIDSWWGAPTYFVFNICTAMVGITGIVVCFVSVFT